MRRIDRGVRIGEPGEVVTAGEPQRAAEAVAGFHRKPGGVRAAQGGDVAEMHLAADIEAAADALIAAQAPNRRARGEETIARDLVGGARRRVGGDCDRLRSR